MNKRDVVYAAMEFREAPYVPWDWGVTIRCAEKLRRVIGPDAWDQFFDGHFITCGSSNLRWKEIDANHAQDAYGVMWDRTVDRDIGTPCDWPLKRPEDLASYEFPDAGDDSWYAGIPDQLALHRDRFSVYAIGFSLYERAWTLRGMTELLMDMIERPEFVEALLDRIVEHNLVQIRAALEFGFDAIYFGDDYGMQTGLIMGGEHWRHFIKPRLARMFEPVVEAGKYVSMHSCGAVAELFDDLVEIGLNLFNPFQPEVMDTPSLMQQYHGSLAFHGGMSVQRILPFGTPDEVRAETQRLIDAGRQGGYIFAPSHAVPDGVPIKNLQAMVDVLQNQEGYKF